MAFNLLLFFIFWTYWRPQEWLFPVLYGLPILDGVVFLAVVSLFVEFNEGRVKVGANKYGIQLLAGLYFATLMSHISNTYFAGLQYTWMETFRYCFFGILLFLSVDRPERLRSMARVTVVLACFMTVHALLQQARGYGFAGQPALLMDRPFREGPVLRSMFFGIFQDPNDLSQMLCAAMPFTFTLTRRGGLFRFALGMGISWFIFKGVQATDSRGGYVGLAATWFVMFCLMLPAKWLPRILTIGALVALFLIPLAEAYLDASAWERFETWGLANRVFKENLLFGIGYGMFWIVNRDKAAHSAYVECYTTLGFVGFFFWFTLILVGVIGAYRVRTALSEPKDAEERWLRNFAGMAVASVTGFITASYFLSRAFVFPMYFEMATVGVLPHVLWLYRDGKDVPKVVSTKEVWTLGLFGSVVAILYVYYSIILLNKVVR